MDIQIFTVKFVTNFALQRVFVTNLASRSWQAHFAQFPGPQEHCLPVLADLVDPCDLMALSQSSDVLVEY